ncbi:SelB domain-containing protein [Herbivorax sp. ANBcel31]
MGALLHKITNKLLVLHIEYFDRRFITKREGNDRTA